MPGGDRTGPMGQGPMTGRGAGLCAGEETPGFDSSQRQMGMGRGRGRGGRGGGRGGRGRFGMGGPPVAMTQPPAATGESELATLKQQVADIMHALNELKTKILGLEKPSADVISPGSKEQS